MFSYCFSFVSAISEIFYWRYLITPPCFAYSIGMAIFTQKYVIYLNSFFTRIKTTKDPIFSWDLLLVMVWHSWAGFNYFICVNWAKVSRLKKTIENYNKTAFFIIQFLLFRIMNLSRFSTIAIGMFYPFYQLICKRISCDWSIAIKTQLA